MDWSSIKRNFRFQSGRSRRVNEQIAAERKKQLAHAPIRGNPYMARPGEPESPRKDVQTRSSSNKPATPKSPGAVRFSQGHDDDMSRANGSAQPNQKKLIKRPLSGRKSTDQSLNQQSSDGTDDFDLRPPTRAKKSQAIDEISQLLFSDGHLNTILHEPELFSRFTAFLHRYRPQIAPVLIRYLETQKAIKAVEYANAVAESVAFLSADENAKKDIVAAQPDTSFQELSKDAFEILVSQALPAYITYNLIKVASEIMTNEITGRQTPVMKGLVTGLSEVFCLTDPNQEDNPIIYASEEFYNMTGYSCDYVIGSNCRFLQGPKTKRHSVVRLRQAVDAGQELSETLLNYRRDGRPFMNILMIAPLHDNKGRVKYHIGAQVDASGLVASGKGLDSFEQFQMNEQVKKEIASRSKTRDSSKDNSTSSKDAKEKALTKLGELSELFDLEETGVVSQRSRSSSRARRSDEEESTGSRRRPRRVFDEESESGSEQESVDEKDKAAWSLAQNNSSGRLPGVYQSYFLMRPSPSLKIIFVSPALRNMGNLVQSPLLSHVTAPPATLNGLKDSFESGDPVTAKVLFSATASASDDGRELSHKQSERKLEEAASKQTGRTTWLSATPLMGADGKVGVWMVVVVAARSLGSGKPAAAPTPESVPQASTSTTDKPQSGSSTDSTLKGVGSEPDSSRLMSSPLLTPKSARPNHIDLPERLSSKHQGEQQSKWNGSPSSQNPDSGSRRPSPDLNHIGSRYQALQNEKRSPLAPTIPQEPDNRTQKADEYWVRKSSPQATLQSPHHITSQADDHPLIANEFAQRSHSPKQFSSPSPHRTPTQPETGTETDTFAQESEHLTTAAKAEVSEDGAGDADHFFSAAEKPQTASIPPSSSNTADHTTPKAQKRNPYEEGNDSLKYDTEIPVGGSAATPEPSLYLQNNVSEEPEGEPAESFPEHEREESFDAGLEDHAEVDAGPEGLHTPRVAEPAESNLGSAAESSEDPVIVNGVSPDARKEVDSNELKEYDSKPIERVWTLSTASTSSTSPIEPPSPPHHSASPEPSINQRPTTPMQNSNEYTTPIPSTPQSFPTPDHSTPTPITPPPFHNSNGKHQPLPQSPADFTPGKSSVVYMDYLRHPGAGKALTGANLRGVGHEMALGNGRGGESYGGYDGYGEEDEEVVRTPFSID